MVDSKRFVLSRSNMKSEMRYKMKNEIKFTGNKEVAYRILDSMHGYIDNVSKDRCVTIVITIEDEPLLKITQKKKVSKPFKFCDFCESEYSNAYHQLQVVCHMPNPPVQLTKDLYKEVCYTLSKRNVSQNENTGVHDYAGADKFLENKLGINDYAARNLCDYILDNDYKLNCQQ